MNELDILQRHLTARNIKGECPACGHGRFFVDGPVALMHTDPASRPGSVRMTPRAFTAALLVCSLCFFIRPFAWAALRHAATQPQPPASVAPDPGEEMTPMQRLRQLPWRKVAAGAAAVVALATVMLALSGWS